MGSTPSDGWVKYHVLGEHMHVTGLFFELCKLDNGQSKKRTSNPDGKFSLKVLQVALEFQSLDTR